MTAATPATPTVENFGFMQKYPFLSAKLGKSMADSAGMDSKDPANLARALSSKTATSKIATFERAPEDQAAIDALFKMPAGAEVGGDVLTTTKATQQAIAEGTRAKMGVYGDLKAAGETYSRLASFNKEAETQKRLAQMKPTEDIDKQITAAMTQAIREKARLRTEMKDINPAQRNAAITARMSVFTEEIANLSQLRSARVDAAKLKIGTEIDATEGRIEAARLHVESLGRELDYLQEIGADRVQYAEVARQYADAQSKLRKAGAGDGITKQELAEMSLIEEFKKNNFGESPDSDDMRLISTRAKLLAADPEKFAILVSQQDPSTVTSYIGNTNYGGGPGLGRLTIGELRSRLLEGDQATAPTTKRLAELGPLQGVANKFNLMPGQ